MDLDDDELQATRILNGADTREHRIYAIKFAVMQKQIDEKDKRIKELEEENVILRKANNITRDLIKEVKIEDITQVINKSYEEFVNQFIPKQKVTDKLKEDIEKAKEQIKHYERQYKTAKEKEDKFHIKSFHRQINRWQSRFETLREILNIIEGEKK